MKKNSLVRYIGGQDKEGKKMFELKINEVYTVKSFARGIFPSGKKPVIKIEEAGDIAFLKSMFVEVQEPLDLNQVFENSLSITLEESVKEIDRKNLNNLNKEELQSMIDKALEFENYEMCAHLKKFMDTK